MRGEHMGLRAAHYYHVGSSPHVWGTLQSMLSGTDFPGIIPACAGNTVSSGRHHRAKRDHPHIRREHFIETRRAVRFKGSSPHARGTRRPHAARLPRRRIIPACAGNTCAAGRATPWPRDHPRMRGEHPSTHAVPPPSGGSSPHARGTHGRDARGRGGSGIIPACAGNTRTPS